MATRESCPAPSAYRAGGWTRIVAGSNAPLNNQIMHQVGDKMVFLQTKETIGSTNVTCVSRQRMINAFNDLALTNEAGKDTVY